MDLAELRKRKAEILTVAVRYGIFNIRVFGSVARGEARDDSDIDLLVDSRRHSLFDLGGFKYDLENLLSARVDVVKPSAIQFSSIREQVTKEAVPL